MRSIAALSLAAGAIVLVAACSESPRDAAVDRWAAISRGCIDCHNDAEVTGGLSLEGMSPADVGEKWEIWERVVRKLRGDLMPPPGSPHPGSEEIDALVAALESSLDAFAAEQGPSPGRVVMHRLNRTEYATAVENLLGVEVDVGRVLPPDITSDGFDNIAEVLRVSPTYLDQYIAAARDISIRAVGDGAAQPSREVYRAKLNNRTAHVDGLPLGTRGGMLVEHYFPADGEYDISVDVSSEPGAELRSYPQGWLEYRHEAILLVDGVRVFADELGGSDELRDVDQKQISAVEAIRGRFHNIRVPVTAGYHKIGATFVARSFAESDYWLESFVPGEGIPDVPRVLGLEVVGPYDASGIGGTTKSRERIFSCYPSAAEQERACATQILSDLARRAYRRPVNDTDLASLLAFYETGHETGGFEAGIQMGILAMLSSTKFLYRMELGEPQDGLAPGTAYPITDLELASRLAFFLWSSGPDEVLLELAQSGRLSKPEIYEQEIRRMLADPRSSSLVTNFAFQWLGVRDIDLANPDPRLYPNFDEDLRLAFEREMELFLDSILRAENHSVVDLLNAKHTFVNERLARHYGINGVRGDQFRRVELDDPQRFGLFGKGAVHLVTSYPDRTSPVLRGTWVMDRILGTPPASPPPDVETNLSPVSNDQPKSVRERLELHRTVTSCNHCHGVIDPLGQALENYNAVGEWRVIERDSGVAVDPSGRLANGVGVASPTDLRNALSADPNQFVQAFTEKLMTFALGRGIEYYDMPEVRAIVRNAAEKDYSFESIIMGIAKSEPFRMRSVPDLGANTSGEN